MDGWTFQEQCFADPLCGGRPVVVMSADSQLQETASALHVQGVLAKPFDIDVLLSTVERLLQCSRPPERLEGRGLQIRHATWRPRASVGARRADGAEPRQGTPRA